MSNATTRGVITKTPFTDYDQKYPAVNTAQTFYPNVATGLDGTQNAAGNLGYMDILDDTQSRGFIGITDDVNTQVLSGGNNGDTLMNVAQPRFIRVNANWSVGQGDIGKKVYWADDQTVALSGTTYGNYAGTIVNVSATWTIAGYSVSTLNVVTVQVDYATRQTNHAHGATRVLAATGNQTLYSWDLNKKIIVPNTAAFTVALPPVAQSTAGDRFQFLKTTSSAILVTIQANAAETINGLNTLALGPNQWDCVELISDGAQWTVFGRQSSSTFTAPANFRNLVDGGDFTTNPWQRGTSGSGITNTLTYTADRFFVVGGASSSISWNQNADTTLAGFSQNLSIQRASANANTAAFNFGQVFEGFDSIKAQGLQVTLSFWAKVGANFSPANVTVALNHATTAASEDSASHLVAASTNWQATPTIINTTFVPTSSWVRYTFTGTVPATATQLGLLLTWTPVGTAGAADTIFFQGFQLEIGSQATPFEHRDVEVELALCQRYCFVISEPASGVIVGAGMSSATNAETIYIPFPTQMRAAPTVTVTAGSFKINVAGTATAVGGGFAAGTTHTPNAMSIVDTLTATVGQAVLLQGGGGAGSIVASADF